MLILKVNIFFLYELIGKIDIDEVRGIVDERTKALVVVTPMRPWSIGLGDGDVRGMLELAKERGIVVIFDNCLRLQVFEEGLDPTQQVFKLAKDVGCDMVYLGGVDESLGLQGYNFSWLVRFGKNLDRIWEHLKAFRLVTPGPSVVTQKGFAEFMEFCGSDFQNIWASDSILYETVTKNVEYLRSHLHRFTAAVKVMILDLEKLGFEDDADFCQEFLAQKKYKCLPLKKTCGGASSGIRVCLTHNRDVYEGFTAALQDFVTQREVAR
jgi:aspartate/methionine/tyrosine aminotransferase